MAYFQARRVGDSVARVRELENIRNFLTSSALTLVIDLFFTFVFLGVMFFYSPLLTWIVLGSFPFYIAVSAGVTPLFRRRLDEKFRRGAENQAFLVESVTGIETLKALAVEPRLPAIRGDIKFDHVSFRYRIDGQEVLQDVSFEVPAGQVVGIVGPSGSGKSTFAKLVQRLYVPERGRVLIDGMDLAMADPAWLRRQIGVVLQENVLFNRSVRENIALADPAMPMERVIATASLAGAHEFILELSEGYDTIVGERGATLSGGQRQRIAIARALVSDPRILIFDEATSALDYESERVIQRNMKEIAKGRTVLIIAHRLSTVRSADRIVTLEHGRLVEDGTHDALIKTGGRYAALHRLQGGIYEVG